MHRVEVLDDTTLSSVDCGVAASPPFGTVPFFHGVGRSVDPPLPITPI